MRKKSYTQFCIVCVCVCVCVLVQSDLCSCNERQFVRHGSDRCPLCARRRCSLRDHVDCLSSCAFLCCMTLKCLLPERENSWQQCKVEPEQCEHLRGNSNNLVRKRRSGLAPTPNSKFCARTKMSNFLSISSNRATSLRRLRTKCCAKR